MDQVKINEALGTVKMLLGLEDGGRDELLSFLLEDAVNMITGYCRISKLPEGLFSLVPVVAADMYRRKGYGKESAPEFVKSVTQGKRSVSVEHGGLDADSLLREYQSRLKPYINRRGRVPSDVE